VTAAEWRDVIRRCALHDRSAILAAVTAALSAEANNGKPADLLEEWASAADAEYLRRVGEADFAVLLRDCRIQLSYLVETEGEEVLPQARFVELLREVGSEVDQHVSSGWSLFHVFFGEGLAPRWSFDPSAPDEEFMQASLIETPKRTLGFDFWRVSLSGLVTVIREYWEDTPDFRLSPRATLDPRNLRRLVGELVWHAHAFASRFSAPLRVHFRCHWRGLRGRRLFVPNAIPFSTRPAETDSVVTTGSWAVGRLPTDIPEIVQKLTGKVNRALDWEGPTAEMIASEMPNWRRP
jgi:hypothetical protein